MKPIRYTEEEIREEFATAQGSFPSVHEYDQGFRRYLAAHYLPCSEEPGKFIPKA